MNIEQAARMTCKSVEEQTRHVEEWTRTAQGAIGKTLNVRLDKKTTLEGVINSVKFSRYDTVGWSKLKIVWEVGLICGSKKVARTVHVSKLPM